jgi:hypothetical protein
MEKFSLTLFDYAQDHQWPRLMGWSEDELRSVPIHYEATGGSDFLNLANFGATGLGVSSESGGGTSAGARSLQNVYVYQSDCPPPLYERLQRLMDQGGPMADPHGMESPSDQSGGMRQRRAG